MSSFNPKRKKSNEYLKDKRRKFEQNSQENDILDYFTFNEEESNIIDYNNGDGKEINPKYNIISFISTAIRPDLYCPYGIIKGNKYNLIYPKEKNEEDDVISVLSNMDSYDEDEEKLLNVEKKNMKIERYFNIEIDISKKCTICDEIGHRKYNCPYSDIKFCYRCAQYGHDKNCTKVKCFRCNSIGHKTFACPYEEIELLVCNKCSCIGHEKDDCLINPEPINGQLFNFECFTCGQKNHILCPLKERNLPLIQKEDDNSSILEDISFPNKLNDDEDDSSMVTNDNRIRDCKQIQSENFSEIIFCSFCGGRHSNDNCESKGKFTNWFDEKRKLQGEKIIEKKIEEYNYKMILFLLGKKNIPKEDEEQKRSEIISLQEEEVNENIFEGNLSEKKNNYCHKKTSNFNWINKDKKSYS